MTKIPIYLVILLGLLLIQFSPALTQERVYPFDHVTQKQGLDWTGAGRLMEDQDGFIWMSTGKGFVKFDGYSFYKLEDMLDTVPQHLGGIRGLFEIEYGVIWLGASNGLFVYNKKNRSLKKLAHDKEVKETIGENNVTFIYQDREERLWISTWGGLNLYKGNEQFERFHLAEDSHSVQIKLLVEDGYGHIWGGGERGLVKVNFDQKTIEEVPATSNLNIRSLYQKDKETLWLGTEWKGLWEWNVKTETLKELTLFPPIVNQSVTKICEDITGDIWISVSRVGLFKINSSTYQLTSFTQDPYSPFSMVSTRIGDILMDSQGNIWLGTVKGVSKINLSTLKFPFYQHVKGWYNDQNSIYGGMYQDSKGGFWYDNAGIGHSYSEALGEKSRFFENGTELCKTSMTSVFAEDKYAVWALCRTEGMYRINLSNGEINKLNLGDSLKAKRITYFANDPSNPSIIWISGTYGLCKYDTETGAKKWFYPKEAIPNLRNNWLPAFYPSPYQKLWTWSRGKSGERKIIYFNLKEERFETTPFQDYRKYLNSSITSIHAISEHSVWIGLKGRGLLEIDLLGGKYFMYTTSDFLPENNVIALNSDDKKNLWIATERYVCHYSPLQDSLLGAYFVADMVGKFQQMYFDPPSLSSQAGEIIFVGTNGLIAFDPDEVKIDTIRPKIVLTDFKVMNQRVKFNSALEMVKEIELSYKDKSITFQLAALHYASSEKNKYQYKLEGWNDEWIDAEFNRTATFTNLPPRKYIFRARGSNADGIWNKPADDLIIHLTVHPPWYQTWWAYLIGMILFMGSILFLYRFQLNRKLVKAETQRLRELDEVKNRLYTNITHEFRTPLTIILGMSDRIAAHPKQWSNKGLNMIKRNGQSLLRLINQMLDLSKLESGKLPLNLIQSNVVPYLSYILESFHSYGEMKDIRVHFYAEEDEIIMDYDPDNLLKIISNLLSNAIKFTAEGGNVYLTVDRQEDSFLIISVRDTGMGIPAAKLPHIFDRFYQADASHTRQGEGTGIGLALTQELVRLMDGQISVKSKENKGTEFKILLPISKNAPFQTSFNLEHINRKQDMLAGTAQAGTAQNIVSLGIKSDVPHLLIVDDNKDIVQYLVSSLQDRYQIEVAYNGQEGIDKAIGRTPDIIISDVMMPEKDGFDLCDTLKNDERTSHIPIVLLTAKADVESRIAGLKRGADAYIPKPFNETELRVRLEKLIALRQELQKRYASFAPSTSEKIDIQIEDAFLLKVREIIEQNISDSEFNLAKLCRAIGMSRSQIFRKIKALTGKSTTQFIRSHRVHKGKKLLETTDLNVSEVSYKVGFSTLAHFSNCFKEEFGVAPSYIKDKT